MQFSREVLTLLGRFAETFPRIVLEGSPETSPGTVSKCTTEQFRNRYLVTHNDILGSGTSLDQSLSSTKVYTKGRQSTHTYGAHSQIPLFPDRNQQAVV